MGLRDHLAVLAARRKLVGATVLGAVLAAVIAHLVLPAATPPEQRYFAERSIVASNVPFDLESIAASKEIAPHAARLAAVPVEEMRTALEITPNERGLLVSASSTSEERTTRMAEAATRSILRLFSTERIQSLAVGSLDEDIATLEKRIRLLVRRSQAAGGAQKRLLTAKLDALSGRYSNLILQRDALLSTEPQLRVAGGEPVRRSERRQVSAPRTLPGRVALGIFFGLILGVLLAIGTETLDPRIRNERDAVENFGAPVIAGVAPKGSRELKDHIFQTDLQDASLITAGWLVAPGEPRANTVLVTTADTGPAAAGVVSAFSDALAGTADKFQVLDAPPLVSDGAAARSAQHADAVVIVARAGATQAPAAKRLGDLLRDLGIRRAGVIFFGSA